MIVWMHQVLKLRALLVGNKIKDKGLSFGENSGGTISNVNFQNTKLGIAVKDGSYLNYQI